MILSDDTLKNDEKALYALRELYRGYGYTRYKVSKFDEYDLYAHNKSFLISENILSFTDTNGKLMALKPDVTLSIVKNISGNDLSMHKVYYNETVYRTSPGSDGFREIVQTGLECIGQIDLYSTCEVLMLAQKSLDLISKDWILDLSHMGFLTGLLETAQVPEADAALLLEYIGNKNTVAILTYCEENAIDSEMAKRICKIASLYAPLEEALSEIEPLLCGERMELAYRELCDVMQLMRAWGSTGRVYLDFSMTQDMRYYNGIIFRGYVNGIPQSILSGGRYDQLLKRMGKGLGAIGFAVYLDLLERLDLSDRQYDTDVLLVFEAGLDPQTLLSRTESLRSNGQRVRVHSGVVDGIRYQKLIRIKADGTEVTEE